jgi:ComF family protein
MKGHPRLFLSSLLDTFFPPVCPLCRKAPVQAAELFCSACSAGIVYIAPPICSRCGLPFLYADGAVPLHCPHCLASPAPDVRIRSAGIFSGALRDALLRFKYYYDLATGEALSRLLSRMVPLLHPGGSYDRILPVPLHPRRLREREFNQSVLLAKHISRRLRLPIDVSSVAKIRDTRPQSTLGEKERRRNIRGAFRVLRLAPIERTRILVVDDVCTTGATIEELAAVLLDAGAQRVDAVTVARALTIDRP